MANPAGTKIDKDVPIPLEIKRSGNVYKISAACLSLSEAKAIGTAWAVAQALRRGNGTPSEASNYMVEYARGVLEKLQSV